MDFNQAANSRVLEAAHANYSLKNNCFVDFVYQNKLTAVLHQGAAAAPPLPASRAAR